MNSILINGYIHYLCREIQKPTTFIKKKFKRKGKVCANKQRIKYQMK